MLSIGSIASAGYYTKAAGYYAEQNGQSKWHGGAKEALELTNGPITTEDLDKLLSGRLPSGQQLGRVINDELKRDLGRDLTFTAPKTVSILSAGPDGTPLINAHDRANTKAMAFAEKYLAKTRIYNPATKKQDKTGDQKIIYGSFREDTSRANDPNLHTHNVVVNLTMDANGKFRSLANDELYAHKILLGAIYRSYMARDLQNMGFKLRDAGKYGLFEIEGISKDVIDTFSKRRNAMKEMAGSNKDNPEHMARLVLLSRPTKETIDHPNLLNRWEKEIAAFGHSFKSLFIGAKNPESALKSISATSVIKGAVSDLSENNRHYSFFEILKTSLLIGGRHVTPDEIITGIKEQTDKGDLIASKDGIYFTTPGTLRREALVTKELDKGHLRGKIIVSNKSLQTEPNFDNLSKGQKNAAILLLSSQSRIVGIQGTAGTGKTTMLKTALPFARQAGLTTIGIAPSGAAVQELAATGMFDKVMTTQKFLLTPHGHSSAMLVVDEASMVDTKSMLGIMQFANQKKMARLVLMGDTKQLGAVNAGAPFAQLQAAGMRTAQMDEIMRQKSARHRKGVSELSNDDVKAAFKTLKPEIHEVENSKLHTHAKDLWKKLNNPKAAIIVQTNAQKAEINQAIKQSLFDKTNGHDAGLKIKVWRPVHLTGREKRLTSSYQDATHIRFNRNYKRLGIKHGDIYKIEKINKTRSTLKLSNKAGTKTFKPAKYNFGKGAIETYKQETIDLHKGDRIRFTRGSTGRSVNNNDMGNIKQISSTGVAIELDRGKTMTLKPSNPSLRHIDHAWANTAHAFQGKTVKDAIVVMPASKSPLTTLKSLYTGASRHQNSLAIVTNNADRLKTNLLERLEMEADPFKVTRVKENATFSPPPRDQVNTPTNERMHAPKQVHDDERGDRSR